MSNYDRRSTRQVTARNIGTLGVTHEQLSVVVREELGLPLDANVNVLFGPVGTSERELFVPFTAVTTGKQTSGRVVFQVLETSVRQWGGSAILLQGRVELG